MDLDATNLENLDRMDRERWSIACAETLIQTVGNAGVLEIAARGRFEFMRVAMPIYEGHAFKYDDYSRMFDRIAETAQRIAGGKPPETLKERLKR